MDPELKEVLAGLKVSVGELVEYNRLSRKNILKTFVLGIFYAFGATAGLAMFIAIIGWVIRLFGGVPIFGAILVSLGEFIK